MDPNSKGPWMFFVLTLGIFSMFLVNGIVNEAIFKISGFNEFGWFLTLVQFVFYILFSGLHMRIIGNHGNAFTFSIPLIRLAIFNVIAMGLTNASVGYMNYPTQLMFKSCKVISVMAAGIMIKGKKYRIIDFIAITLMTIGLIFFTLADVTVSPVFQTKGVSMVIGAVFMDGVVGIYQEELTQKRGLGLCELIFKTYFIGAIFIFAFTWSTGQLVLASCFTLQHWSSLVPLFLAFSITGYIGVLLILALIERFGALPTVIVTTSRKVVTIALSFLIFNKPFSNQYIWSGLLILLGIYLNAQKTHLQSWLNLLKYAKWPWKQCKGWLYSKNEWIV